jgi:hypothetical protein
VGEQDPTDRRLEEPAATAYTATLTLPRGSPGQGEVLRGYRPGGFPAKLGGDVEADSGRETAVVKLTKPYPSRPRIGFG